MMHSHAPASTRKQAGYLHRNGFLSQFLSVLLAWTMVMSSLPVYATDQPRAEWVHSWDVNALTKPTTELAQHRPVPPITTRPSIAKTLASPRLAANPTIAALHAPVLPGSQGSDLFLNAFSGGLFAPPLQASGDSQLQVSVGFADNSSSSANFPSPWNSTSAQISFVGGGTVYRAGAIRLDNPGLAPITVDQVTVDLGRPGPVFQLWQNVTVPAGGSAILTQTQNGNFNTSASPIVGCGLPLAQNEARVPKVTVTIAGASSDYLDTAHVLDTGGFDSSCRGNQSLEWRPIGTTGMEAPSGTIQLITDGAPHAVGTQDTTTIAVSDANNQPLANVAVAVNVVNGPNSGKSFTGVTDVTGTATIPYSSSLQGNDQIQAVAANASGGSLVSQQAATVWTSADACVAPAAPSASASRLVYVGQNSIFFGNSIRLAALLTDGTGNPLGGRSVSFGFGGQTAPATTDSNGVATVSSSSLPVGQSAVSINFAGDAGDQAAQLSASVTVLPAPTLLRYTGTNLVTALGQQQVSAKLTNALGTIAITGRTITFTLNGVSTTGVTDANGSATATLNFSTALTTGAGQLQINFAGDSNYQPSSRTASVQIYQPMPFVIWGGNTGGLRIGQRVNFWGSQWETQVINGQYFAANPSFKGWSGVLTGPIQPCQTNVTPATLTSACWDVKPGQSFPPNQTLPSLIEVIVSTVVDKSGSDVFGNIACGAVLAVDHTPPYGAVPGQDGFGTIVAVDGSCSGVFPAPAVLTASQQQTPLVLPNQGVPVTYNIQNTGMTDATGVTLSENFDQVTPATGSANIGTITAGQTNTGNFQVTIPGISPRQSPESSVDYQSRLAAQDGRIFTSEAEATFSDVFSQIYAPLDFSSFSTLTLPRLSVGISGISCVAPGSNIPYSVLVANDGSATASHIAATLALPDGTTATPVVPNLTAGTRFVGTVNWSSPGITAKSPTESTQDYLARLQAADGVTLPAAVFSSTWQDALGNSYGPVEQPFVALTQRIPVVSTTVPATQALLPSQSTQFGFNVSNTGSGNAVQVTLRIKRQDGTFINVPNFSLPGGQSATLNASYSAPAIAAKGASETDAAYISRLQSVDNTALNLDAVLQWSDPANNNYGPTDNPFTATEQLPILSVSLDAPAKANSGDTISYVVTLTNIGHAAAKTGIISITLPDGLIAHPAPLANSIAPGASTTATVSYTIPANHPNGTISATASVGWSDSVANSYGPLSASASTDVTLPNLPPVVSAGADQTVPFPNNFPLQGSVTDDGKPVGGQLTSTWAQVSGPSTAIFADPHNPKTTVQLNAEGTYVLKLTGDDSQLQSSAQVSITTTRGNTGPVVTVGPDQTLQLPVNTASLTGSATDDGLPVGSSITYLWKEVTGPGTVTFATPTAPNTTATFPALGVYLLRLSASDSQLTGSADLRVTVLPHNNPPTVNAGPAQTIFQPVNTANMQGVISDDGLPTGGTLTSTWSVVSGPGIVTFANPGSPTTAATFSTIGVYVLRLTASDSQLTAQADTTVTVKPANLPPVVNAGPQQTVVLPSNANTLPLFPTLIPISTGFNSPIAADYHQPTNKVVMSVNYSSGQPHNFELVAQDGSRTQFSNISGLTDEVYIAAARDEGGGKSIGGFLAGEMFTGSGVPGVIVRISPDGNTVRNPWVTLPGESGLLRGQLYIDRTGVFGGDLIVATTSGNIWRVTNAGVPTKLANVGVPPEGLITLPTDTFHYGPWAGKIVTGSENSGRIFTIDPQGVLTFFDFGIFSEHIKLVGAGENYFGVDFGSSRLLGIPAPELAGMVGDLLIGEETPGNLWQIHWNGTRFEGTKIARAAQWEGAAMAPAGIVQVNSTTASVTLNGTVTDDGLPIGGTLTSSWSKISGPGTTTFVNPASPVTSVTFSLPGTYVLRLTASDTELTSSSDTTVVISANAPPVVSAGPSQETTFPAPATLQGTATDDGLPAGSSLSTFWTKAIGPGSVQFTTPSFDATDNFSATSNPSGPWTYGSTPTRGGAFTPYAFTGQVLGMPGWFRTSPASGTTFPLLAYNNTGISIASGTFNIPPATLLLHPGAAGENSVIRFTAPATASYLVQGRFYGIDTTTTDVSILLNSSTTLLSGNIAEQNAGVPFTFVKKLTAGDKLDFSVGFGNGNNNSDSTGMQLIITQAGDPSTTATFSSPGDYVLRLAASDSELFSFNDTHVHVNAQCVPQPSGLVGWWPGDGDARDLALANTGVIEDGVTFVPGMVGSAFSLNGGAADVVAPSTTALNVSSLTLSAWVFPLDLGTGRPILEYSSTNGTIGVHMWENLNSSVQVSPGSLYANIIDTNGTGHIMATGAFGGATLQLKQWTHVAVTYDHATGVARMFVNGAFAATSNLGVFTPRTALPLYIGARPNSTHFLGNIDEPQIYNRALSASEIQAIYTAGSAGVCKPTGPQPPVVSAGLNQTISLPVTQVNLNGSASDPNGGTLSTAWSVTSGTGNVVFGNATSPTTTATFSAPGVYVLRLTASDNQATAFSEVTITLVQPINKAPQVSAGPNQTIQFPQSSVTLNGTVTDDGLPFGSTVTQQWSTFSGPAPVTFSTPTQSVTQATFSTPGTYTLRLTATDSEFTSSAQVTITVLAAPTPNQAPSISVSVDNVNLTLPANTANLTGTITDDGQPTGSTVTAQWSQVSGPAPATFSNPTSASTKATFSVAGSYVLKLTASDSQLSNSVSIPITVNPPAPNQAPSVTVIASQNSITLPASTLSLTGKITDDGLPVGGKITLQWSALSGPAPVTFSNPTGGSTQATFAVAGTYVLQLAASDSQLTGTGSVSVIVNPAGTNQAPVVSISADNTAITLPTNNVTLTGTITDDGLPTGTISTQWSQISGPAATITQLTQTSVKVTFTTAGVYTFKLTASDGQLSTSATINITVTTAGGNQPPAVTAGANQTITLPQTTASLRGDARDDGLPAGSTLSVTWSALSGPAPVAFSDPNSLVTQATFGAAGVYVLQLLASDTQLQSTAQVTITVLSSVAPPPPPPVVTLAGFADGQEITSPTPIVGSVSSGTWKLEYSLLDGSGNPTTFVTFASGAAPVSNATLGTFDPTVLLNGQYVVRFSSTDNAGQTSSTSSTVDVSRNTKVGNFTLSFNDLSVPLPGLPITISRMYDSRDKRIGDFGVGWTLTANNVRVQKNGGAIGTAWEETQQWSGFFPTYCLHPLKQHTVSVTFPDGRVYKFQAASTPQCQQIVPISNPQISFTQVSTGAATAGASLVPIGDSDFLLDGGIPGTINIVDFELNFADYSQFQLTTADGYHYNLDLQHGATSVIDPAGNTLVLNTNGVISSTGQSVAFTRDSQNRITQITDPSGNSLHYAYNAAGDLVSFTDRVGNVTTYTYDGGHFLQDILDPRGVQAIRNTYDDNGRLTSTTDGSGNTISYTHNVAANQEIVTDRLGNPTLFEYDADGNITHVTDALGNTTASTFDANDNRLSTTNALGNTTSYTYDAAGNQLSMTDALGHTTRSTFDANNHVLTTTDALGRVTTNTYDSHGNLLTTTDPLGNVTTTTYNSQGLPATVKDALGNLTSFTYDTFGNVNSQTDALGNVTSFTFDGNGNRLSQTVKRTKSDGTLETLTSQYEYDADNHLTKTTYPDGSTRQTVYNSLGKKSDVIDELGRTTHFDYDANGRLIKTTYPDSATELVAYDANDRRISSTDRAGRVTTYTYDAINRPTKITYPDGASAGTTYDAISQIVASTDALGNITQFAYDAAQRRTQITNALNQVTSLAYDAAGNRTSVKDPLNHTTQFAYDAANSLIKTTFPDATTLVSVYDAVGRQISRTDQAGKVTAFGYDAVGRMTSVTDALNHVTQYGYDEIGNRISQTDANGHTTRFAFDQRGRRIQKKLPLGQVENYSYDLVGNMASKTDFNGHTTTYVHDALNRLTSKQADPFFVQNGFGAAHMDFAYTATGRRASMADASGSMTYTYDSRDRLLSASTPFGAFAYTYDAAGNELSINSSNTGGASMAYTYDSLNRLASATDVAGTTTYSYDAAGNLSGFAYPNGTASTYTYDTLNRLTQMQSVCATGTVCGTANQPIARYTYTLGPAGNRLSVAELSGRSVQYGYDDLYRITSETVAGAAPQNGAVSYQYDSVGNRLQMTSTLPAIASGLLNYDANDRISTVPFDDDGNQLNSGSGTNVYDFENHLIKSGSISFVYDGDGNRVAKTLGSSTTNYLVDSNNPTGYAQVLDELQNGTVTRTYSYGLELIDQRQVVAGTPTTSFYGYDGHGSVRFLTSPTGAVTDTYDYDAFGNLISSTGTTPNNYRYAGQQFDPDLNLYYNRARYLDVRNGRFLSADMFEGDPASPLSLHKYVHVLNDPVLLTDPSGYTPLTDFVNQLNSFLRRMNISLGPYTARALGVIAHAAIEWDVFTKLTPQGHMVAFEVPIPGGRIDLIVDLGIYEIKPMGGTVDPQPQLSRYLAAMIGFGPGTYPFDDYVSQNILPLPVWVQLHYELVDQGVIEYDFQFNYSILIPVLVFAAVRVAQAAYTLIMEVDFAGGLVEAFI